MIAGCDGLFQQRWLGRCSWRFVRIGSQGLAQRQCHAFGPRKWKAESPRGRTSLCVLAPGVPGPAQHGTDTTATRPRESGRASSMGGPPEDLMTPSYTNQAEGFHPPNCYRAHRLRPENVDHSRRLGAHENLVKTHTP